MKQGDLFWEGNRLFVAEEEVIGAINGKSTTGFFFRKKVAEVWQVSEGWRTWRFRDGRLAWGDLMNQTFKTKDEAFAYAEVTARLENA